MALDLLVSARFSRCAFCSSTGCGPESHRHRADRGERDSGDPSHNYPFFASDKDLATNGYVEEEFLIQGSANRYTTPSLTTGTVIGRIEMLMTGVDHRSASKGPPRKLPFMRRFIHAFLILSV
jgi:hypothetical protein